MRIPISLAALAFFASVHAPVAAQSDAAPIHPAPALVPLPAALVPDDEPRAADERATRVSARRFLVSVGVGTLAGAATGLVVGAITTDGCERGEEWCILSWEEEVAIHGVAGAMVGAGVGAVYGLVTGVRGSTAQPAPVTVAPSADSGVRLGVTLRH